MLFGASMEFQRGLLNWSNSGGCLVALPTTTQYAGFSRQKRRALLFVIARAMWRVFPYFLHSLILQPTGEGANQAAMGLMQGRIQEEKFIIG